MPTAQDDVIPAAAATQHFTDPVQILHRCQAFKRTVKRADV